MEGAAGVTHMGPPISGASGDCTALGHHAFGELSICVVPERSLDWPEVVRRSLGCTRLLMVESSVLAVTKLLHRWLSVRGHWALCLMFFLSFHFVTLSGILLSLLARGHQCRLLDRKPEAKAKESQRKPNTGLARFQPHGSSSKSLPQKIDGIIMVGWCQTEAFLSF